jgi:hypothetical protein
MNWKQRLLAVFINRCIYFVVAFVLFLILYGCGLTRYG